MGCRVSKSRPAAPIDTERAGSGLFTPLPAPLTLLLAFTAPCLYWDTLLRITLQFLSHPLLGAFSGWGRAAQQRPREQVGVFGFNHKQAVQTRL